MYTYDFKLVRIIDGDSLVVDIDLGFGIWLHKQHVRLYGIDTPELRTRDKVEKQYGVAARDRLKELMKDPDLKITTILDKDDKFGRILAKFGNVTETLIAEHYGVAYMGQGKEDIKEEHLRNRGLLSL